VKLTSVVWKGTGKTKKQQARKWERYTTTWASYHPPEIMDAQVSDLVGEYVGHTGLD